MNIYNLHPLEDFLTCKKTRLPVYFWDESEGALSLANVPCRIDSSSNNGLGPCVTSYLTGVSYYVDGEKALVQYANDHALDRYGRQRKHNFAQCAQFKKDQTRVENRAEIVLRCELESGRIKQLRPNQVQAHTPAPAVTPSTRNVPTPPGQTTNNGSEIVDDMGNQLKTLMSLTTTNVETLGNAVKETNKAVKETNEAVKQVALQTTQNTKDIAALQARDGEKAKSIAELKQRLENLEGGSVGRTTSFVPPPVRRPAAISSDADDVDVTPTPSASNQSSVAFVKGQKVGYRRGNGNIESATIVGVHDDPSHPDKPFFTLGMPDGHEIQ